MRCASCGFENPEGAKFCIECGGAVKHSCPSCGFDNLPQAKFCADCGTTLGAAGTPSPAKSRTRKGAQRPRRATQTSRPPATALSRSASPEAERRQLTVMFCDLVGSTALSEQLDPEELREVVCLYQETCAAVIQRYDGHIAQHLGDGVLVYFGYPAAHEDDAQRAVRAGLEIIQALQKWVPSPLVGEGQPACRVSGVGRGEGAVGAPGRWKKSQAEALPLQVRIGIHTGLVVIGEIGSSKKREILALGETPNIAARVQGIAEPNTVVISAATQRLVQGLFACQDLGPQDLKGLTTPVAVYQVLGESGAQSRFEAAVQKGLTPLVGREHEVGLLQERWEQAKAGAGQVVLLSGEPGIGKSRLVQELEEQLEHEGVTRIEFRCSPYHQNSALYPIIDHLQRLLQFTRDDAPAAKLEKLQHMLSHSRFPQADTVPLLTALLSLPHPEGYPPLTISPQKQKEKTQAALVAWMVEEAEKAAVYCAWEDLHWVDPSTLEVLTLFLDQVPTTRLLVLLTFRPEFTPPWGNRSHLSQLTLSRLGRSQVEAMVERVTGGKALPSEVVQQIVAKTDGVPLFVEELTKSVVESGLVREEEGRYVGAHGGVPIPPLAIPTTLQDSLRARLDRLATARDVAQIGATLGREFSYELLQAVAPDEARLPQALAQLVDAEILYQRGQPPQTRYLFKHALIQEAAYHSLLKGTRQQYHRRIAQVLEQHVKEGVEIQPELLAHHYMEAGLIAQALPYWQRAGEVASARSANVEAISHLTTALELLKTRADTSECAQQELTLQTLLGSSLMAIKGFGAPEVEHAYARALELCRQVGETPQLFPALAGMRVFYLARGELQTEQELAEQLLRLAQSVRDPVYLLAAHIALGESLYIRGEGAPAREHFEQGITLCDPQQSRPPGAWLDNGVLSLSYAAAVLHHLGYPDQASQRLYEALARAQERSHPLSLAWALSFAATLHQLRREGQATQERAEATIALSNEHGFPFFVALGTALRGWALVEQGQVEEGIVQIRQGLAGYRAIGAEVGRSRFLALLAEAYGRGGQAKEGLSAVAEALACVDKTGGRFYEAELYRLKGTLTLQSTIQGPTSTVEAAAEGCFLKAIEIARKQQAKSWELRAVMSVSQLWQQQGKKDEARQMLAEIYGWFTEGFDTKDLQEAKALLEELA